MSLASAAENPFRLSSFRGRGAALIVLIYAVLAITVVYPLLAVLIQSFSEGSGLTTEKIHEVFTTPKIVGKTVTEDLLDSIFSQFCIGK